MIEFDAVSLCLNNRTILKNVSFDIKKGETALLVGSSGAGKSTILRLIIGLIKPTSGHVRVLGQNIAQLSETALNRLRKKLSLVFQNGALFDSLTLAENVAFFLQEQNQLSESEIQQRVQEIMAFFGLENFAHYYPAQISGGMKKRVSIARAIMTQPELLLYDEPTAGLDPLAARKVVQLINDLRQNFHVTSLIVTHEIHHFDRVVDRLIMLKNATIHYDGPYDLSILDRFEEADAQLECFPEEEINAEL